MLRELANSSMHTLGSTPTTDGALVEYVTEDGVTVRTGDRAYNYYDMRPGTIGPDSGSGWFDFHHDGERTTLNGRRICTMQHARRRGFPRA